ncbi:WD40-repeat-containing domain protein [Phakopsora pachyrhizi]|nr:WD40-repeat-containing domain protein [Phakopsora pachyrhizi]
MEFLKLQQQPHQRLTSSNAERLEGKYWREFKNPVFLKSYAPISHISFSPKTPHRYCVSSGTKVQVYSPKTLRVVKTIARFQLPARFSEIKPDGKLIASSDDSGLVQIFDLNSRAILRSFNDHKQPVHVARFSPHSSNILTCSDDSSVRLYDLATSKILRTFTGHSDYVRTGSFASPNLILSGGYDGTIKLWDDRMEESGGLVWTLKHKRPIENILTHPSGTLLVSAGGPLVKVWDILGGSGNQKSLLTLGNHQKTVTSLSWASGPLLNDDQGLSTARRLLSAGLDGLVKIYDSSKGTYKVQHTIKYSSPILSLAVSPDNSLLVVGCTDGSLSMRKRSKPTQGLEAIKSNKKINHSSIKDFSMTSATAGNEVIWGRQDASIMEEMACAGLGECQDDEKLLDERNAEISNVQTSTTSTSIVKRKKKKKLQAWDQMLRAFRYGDALEAVFAPNIPPNITFQLIRELIHRDGLHQALSEKNEATLEPILRFLIKHFTDPRWFTIASDVLNCIIELYNSVFGKSQTIDSLILTLFNKISSELKLHSSLFGLTGQIEIILANLTINDPKNE